MTINTSWTGTNVPQVVAVLSLGLLLRSWFCVVGYVPHLDYRFTDLKGPALSQAEVHHSYCPQNSQLS